MRSICDIIFSIGVLIGLSYGWITNQLSMGEFLIGITLNYVGTRYLLMADIDLHFIELEIESAQADARREDE